MKKGSTLIELLVIIAIIGILTSVVLGSVAARKEKGKEKSSFSVASEERKSYSVPIERDPVVDESDRRINSCIENISSERERIQKRFQEEMSGLDDRISRQCFNNYSR